VLCFRVVAAFGGKKSDADLSPDSHPINGDRLRWAAHYGTIAGFWAKVQHQ
jgi:hypothetical protein